MANPTVHDYDDSQYFYDEESDTIQAYEGGEVYDANGILISSGVDY